jgi:hypothetical protein
MFVACKLAGVQRFSAELSKYQNLENAKHVLFLEDDKVRLVRF